MEIVALILMITGFLVMLVYGIQLLIIAFQTSILWGLGYIFIPFVALIFIIMHWEKAKSPFLKSLIGVPFYIVGMILMQQVQPM